MTQDPGSNIPSLRILTINVHKGFSFLNQKFVLHELREEIRRTDAEIIFLQEVTGENVKKEKKHGNWPTSSQYEFLAENIWSDYAYGKNAVYTAGHHGNAILSKYPMCNSEKKDISTNRFEHRGLLYSAIQIPGWPHALHCICLHLGLWSVSRKKQMNMLNDFIALRVPRDNPVIVAGDFNDWNQKTENNFAFPSGFKEVFMEKTGRSARTFPAWLPVLKLDRIYYRELSVRNWMVHDHVHWKKLSDHLGLFAEMQFGPERRVMDREVDIEKRS